MSLISFENVSFSYVTEDDNGNEIRREVLKNFNLNIEQGSFVAILGHNGSGKSTLAKHLNAILTPTEGEVLVDGVNVRDYTFDTLYNKLGYVTQKAVLFAGSIRDNVYFGESEAPADDEGLAQAVELSQAKEFVDKLPDGTQLHLNSGSRITYPVSYTHLTLPTT